MLFSFSFIVAEEKLNWNVSLLNGVSLSEKHLEARIYYDLEQKQFEEFYHGIKTWGTKLHLFDCISLGFGNMSLSGAWSKFNNPCPSDIDPLKNEIEISKTLVISLPTSSSVNDSVLASVELDLPVFRLNGYFEGFGSEKFSGGVCCSFLFKHSNPSVLTLQTTTTWQTIPLSKKPEETWFLENPYFKSQQSHSFIQEIAIKSFNVSSIFNFGVMQMPFIKNSWFFRNENSFLFLPFLLNIQSFYCSEDYLCHDGSFVSSPIAFGINPQLRFSFDSDVLRNINIGFSCNANLSKAKVFYIPMQWEYEYTGLLEIILNTVTVGFEVENGEDFSSELNFLYEPVATSVFKREWGLKCEYSKFLEDADDYGNLLVKNLFDFELFIDSSCALDMGFFCESKYDLSEKRVQPAILLGISNCLELDTQYFRNTQTLSVKSAIEFSIQEKKPAQLHADFSIILRL